MEKRRSLDRLSSRERQVMEVLFRLGEASAAEILADTQGDIPSYSAVRSILRSLTRKGYVTHAEMGLRYVYRPVARRESLSRSALVQLLETFFDGSPEKTMKALIDVSRTRRYDIDYEELERILEEARREGR